MGIPFLNTNFSGANKLTFKCWFILLNKANQQRTQQTAKNAFPCIEFHWSILETQPVSLTGSICYILHPLSEQQNDKK